MRKKFSLRRGKPGPEQGKSAGNKDGQKYDFGKVTDDVVEDHVSERGDVGDRVQHLPDASLCPFIWGLAFGI